jgi:thioredoxin 1
MQAPILNELADELVGKLIVGKVNVDENEEIAGIYGISSIPTLLIFKNGEIVDKTIGLTSKAALSALLIKHI